MGQDASAPHGDEQLRTSGACLHASPTTRSECTVPAASRDAKRALFVVCAPSGNNAFFWKGVLDEFRAHLERPESLLLLPLDELVKGIEVVVAEKGDAMRTWSVALMKRYANI